MADFKHITRPTTNTFVKGMNKDLDKSIRPSSTYLHAENFRVVSSDAGTSGAIENIKGNTKIIDSADISGQGRIVGGQYIIGSAKLRDWLVLFTTNITSEAYLSTPTTNTITSTSSGGGVVTISTPSTLGLSNGDYVTIIGSVNYDGTHEVSSVTGSSFQITHAPGSDPRGGTWYYHRCQIYAFKLTAEGEVIDDSDSYLNPTLLGGYPGCIYDDKMTSSGNHLDFLIHHHIKTISRYESSSAAKIYWTDSYNNLKWVNILDDDLGTQTVDKFDFIPEVTLPKPWILNLITGTIKSGRAQYTYQLYKAKGAETLYAPLSDLISFTADNENLANSQHYEGSEFDVQTGKGAQITIYNADTTGYDFVRGVAIHYNTLSGLPTIRIFEERAVESGSSVDIILNDVGDTIGTLQYDDITVLNRTLFTCRDIATKDNYLFAANIEEDVFDIGDFDARSYRFALSSTTCRLYHNYTGTPATDPYYNCTGGTTLTNSTWSSVNGAPGGLSNDPVEDIPETADTVNLLNNYDNDGTGNYQYKYQFNSSTLGASGPNIDISFDSSTITADIDDNDSRFTPGSTVAATPVYQVTESTSDNKSYTGYASPYISYRYPGYARDEIYRFGIVFYDSRGRSSYVRWICDLRMPDHNEHPITSIPSANVRASVLFPKFNVHFTEQGAAPTGAVAYQIVRVKREGFEDRNILAQGLLTSTRLASSIEYPELLENSDAAANDTNEYVYLNSPEITFNRNLSYSSGDKLVAMSDMYTRNAISGQSSGSNTTIATNNTDGLSNESRVVIYGTTSYNGTWDIVDGSIVPNTSFDITASFVGDEGSAFWTPKGGVYLNSHASYTTVNKLSDWLGISIVANSIDSIDTCAIVGPTDSTYNLGGSNTVQTRDDSGTVNDMFKGTALLVKHSGNGTWTPADTSNSDRRRFLCNYRRNNWLSQYGGNTYQDRSYNTYIAAGSWQYTVADHLVHGGDTYIVYFNQLSLMSDLSVASGGYQSEVNMFPVETTINCDLRHDKSDVNKLLPADTAPKRINLQMTQETGGTQDDGTNEYEQETDLYLYNTVYSQENTTVPLIAKPVEALYSISEVYDTRVKYSDRKVDGEVSDSWFRFRTNNFKDVEKERGFMTNLEMYKNSLMFWQEHAFGVLSVSERSVLSTDTGEGLVLGTGGL